MARTLKELQSDIEAHEAAATPGSSSEKIYGILVELISILEAGKGSQSDQACDAKTAGLNTTINNQAKLLQATKDALHIGDEKTMAQMPDEAGKIYADAQKWKDTIR